jgi:hypothetical protein
MAVRLSALRASSPLPPRKRLSRPQGHIEGLGKLKKKIHLIRTQTHGLPACGILPQPTTLSRAQGIQNSR